MGPVVDPEIQLGWCQVPRRYNKWGPTSPYNGSQYAFCYVAKIVQSPVESNLGWEIVKLLKG